jgi:hypothetical protein
MQSLEPSGFAEFDRMVAVFRRTRELLDLAWQADQLPDEAADVIANQSLPHVEDIEQGFRVWLRAGAAEIAELRTLVARAGVGAAQSNSAAEERAALSETMHELAFTVRSELAPAPTRALAALDHARLVFALMPRAAAEDVHFPAGRRTYADIAAPRRPAELADRIEELERSLWSLATGNRPRLSDGRYRRTYGFFDTAARISGNNFLAA